MLPPATLTMLVPLEFSLWNEPPGKMLAVLES